MSKQSLQVIADTFVIHSLPNDAVIPAQVFNASIYFIGKTMDELSLVVPDTIQINSEDHDSGWRALEVLGPLNLSLVGIMAQIGSVLATAKVSIFVLSTFETDYFLVKQVDLTKATAALIHDGYRVNL
jgi:hypothetical protein